ncbi:MAG TPA: NADP-dependent malic enzyme [Chloroflexi bacterium]|jgi:malate dehydrogenase (oxaloacetate-decarboxylating)|nr:NADP-dependent malic enzyme [Chloroflexota bacterium]
MSDRNELEARADKPSAEAMRLHRYYRGKIQTTSKCAIRSLDDLSIWYSPGVAAPCLAINEDPGLIYDLTNKGNTVAVVSDGTRVLGLGDIGAEAAMPVMEGKALLFKYLGGVDAAPICLKTKSADDIIQAVRLIQPCYGGINLEDIAQPKCFKVLDTLRADPDVTIPVFHDDQQGTATVLLAGLLNALKITGRELQNIRIALIGMGAANVATLRLLLASGVSMGQIVACDSRGILHREREDVRESQADFPDKWRLCQESNVDDLRGGIAEAMRGADVCIALAKPGPGTIKPEWVAGMARDSIVFPCSNPVPEIWPWEAKEAGARIVGTGRSDFPNQLNNSLGFPAIFRGALDVRARSISDEMCLAAADAIARYGEELGLDDEHIVPSMSDSEVYPREAIAVGMKAIGQGLAGITMTRDELEARVNEKIKEGRELIDLMMREGAIAPVPEE